MTGDEEEYDFVDNSNRSLSPSTSPSEQDISAHTRSSDSSKVVILGKNEWEVPTNTEYIQNPYYRRQNMDFQGREQLLTDMDKILLPPQKSSKSNIESSHRKSTSDPCIFVLRGAGGIGKTQVAAHYLHTRRSEFDAVFWVQATSTENLEVAFNNISESLQMYERGSTGSLGVQPQRVHRVVEWLKYPAQSSVKKSRTLNWLLVFDDVSSPLELQKFWPYNSPGSVIVTTRNAKTTSGSWHHDRSDTGSDLEPLEPEAAVNLLRAKLPPALLSNETNEQLHQVVKALSHWPLAIVYISGHMRSLEHTPSTFLQNYQHDQTLLGRYLNPLQEAQDGYIETMVALWSSEGVNTKTSRLLSVLALLMPEDIPESIVVPKGRAIRLEGYPSSQFDYDETVAKLIGRSDISRKRTSPGQPGTIHIHAIIQEVTRLRLAKSEGAMRETFNATIDLLKDVWPPETRPVAGYHEPNAKVTWENKDLLVSHLSHMVRTFVSMSEIDGKAGCATHNFVYLMSELSW
jgi:hypothetical protein